MLHKLWPWVYADHVIRKYPFLGMLDLRFHQRANVIVLYVFSLMHTINSSAFM